MTELTRQQREYLQLSESSARTLRSRIEDILDFSQMELDNFRIDHKEFSPEACLHGAVFNVAASATQKGISLRMEIQAGVPERIVGDPTRVHQVLVKILENAIKFSSQGEVVVSLQRGGLIAGESSASAMLRFDVRDQGSGIPRDRLESVFDPFRQGDGSLTRQHAGTGLGLAMCKRLVRVMGGQIAVKSEVGRGSTFSFTIRYEPVSAASGNLSISRVPVATGSPSSRLQVLIVEDNLVNAAVAKRLLEARGFYCLEARNGLGAVRTLTTATVDLVIMDIQMPEMDGYTATQRIRELEGNTAAHVPILALTAHAMADEKEKCLTAGMDGYISKPVDRQELYAAIDELLEVEA